MKEYKLNFKLFLSVIALFSIIILGAVLCISGKFNLAEVKNLVWDYAYVTLPLSGIWLYFEKWGWKSKLWKWTRGFLKIPPDLSGRWEGTLKRIDQTEKHKFVLEVKQTLTKLLVNTYSSLGHSESILDAIASDKMGSDFYLTYLWMGEVSKNKNGIVDKRTFYGYTMLKLINSNNEKRLSGSYFTNRVPVQTMGDIEVKWTTNELKQSL